MKEARSDTKYSTEISLPGTTFIVGLAAVLVTLGVRQRYSMAIEPPPARSAFRVEDRLDPNLATWWQLDRMPGLGASMARRIASEQTSSSRSTHSAPRFLSLQDLLRVQGLGQAKLKSLAPYLRFPAYTPPSAAADRR